MIKNTSSLQILPARRTIQQNWVNDQTRGEYFALVERYLVRIINVSRGPRLIIVDERDKRAAQLNALVARIYYNNFRSALGTYLHARRHN